MNMTTQRPTRYQVGVGAAAVAFNGYEVPLGLVRQSPPAWRSGFEIGRDTRDNVFPFVLDSLDGGFLPSSGFFSPREKNRVYYNEGIMVHQPKIACLAYASTAQATLDNIDIRTARDTNKRIHALMSSLGVSGQRFLAAIGAKVYIDTSTSNPALVLCEDTLTDNVLSIANLRLNNVDYTAISTDGTTDDTVGTTNVTGSNPFVGGTKLVTHAHADDGFPLMDYFSSLGGSGWNIFGGVLNQMNGFWAYPSTAVSLPLTSSTMLPIVYKDTKDALGTGSTTTTAWKSPTAVGLGRRGDIVSSARSSAKWSDAYWSIWQQSGTPTADTTLLTSISGYWKLTEASSTRADTSGNGFTLTDNNTVTGNPGPGGSLATASQFTAANSEYLSCADNATLSMGDIAFTIVAKVYLDSLGVDRAVLAKSDAGANTNEYEIGVSSSNRFYFKVGNGSTSAVVTNTSVTATTATWYFLVAKHDPAANTITLAVNQGTAASASYSGGSYNSAHSLVIGQNGGGGAFWNGRIAGVGIWKKIVSDMELTYLYNNGAAGDTVYLIEGALTTTSPFTYADALNDSDGNYLYALLEMFAETDDGTIAVVSPSGQVTDELVPYGYDFSEIPKGNEITGIEVSVESHQSTTVPTDVYFQTVQAYINGSPVGLNLARGVGPASTTDNLTEFGSADAAPSGLKGSDVQTGLGVGLSFRIYGSISDSTAGDGAEYHTDEVYVDHVKVRITHRSPGTQMALPKGGWSPGKPPHRANRLAYCHPLTDEETTVLKPRIITFIDIEHDPEGDILVGSTSQPPTQMGSVDDACWYQGGLAIEGGSAPGVGEAVKLVDDDNVTRDLGFPAVHGSAAVRVATMWAQGAVLMAYVCHADSTDAQLWMYWNGKWNAFGALFSKTLGGVMSTLPLGWAEKTQNTFQKTAYCFYPSSTNTAVVRQFVPLDPMNSDPFLTNTTQVKQNGPLYVQTAEIEVLPSEANNAVMALQMQSRRVDDNTAYGSVNVKVNTAGDHAFAASAINETFDAAAECFVDRNLASGGDPGIAFNTVIHRLTLDHQSGTAETPNALPLIDFMVSDHVPLERFRIYMVKGGQVAPQAEGPVALAKRLRALMNTKVAQPFLGVGRDIPVKFKYEFTVKKGSMSVGEFSWDDVQEAYIECEQTPGANR